MHKSLTVGANRVLIGCWAVVVAAFNVVTAGTVVPVRGVGGFLGIWAGLLQRNTIKADAGRLVATKTALDVRSVLVSRRTGKWSIAIGWSCGLLLIVSASGAGDPFGMLAGWMAGYFAFMLVRDAVAYTALRFVADALDQDVDSRRAVPKDEC